MVNERMEHSGLPFKFNIEFIMKSDSDFLFIVFSYYFCSNLFRSISNASRSSFWGFQFRWRIASVTFPILMLETLGASTPLMITHIAL